MLGVEFERREEEEEEVEKDKKGGKKVGEGIEKKKKDWG